VDISVCLGELYVERCQFRRSSVLYPRDRLRGQSNIKEVFMKTDTHMTDFGTAISTAAAVEALLGEDQSQSLQQILERPATTRDWTGDLGGRFLPPRTEIRDLINGAPAAKWFHNRLSGGNNGIVDILINPNSSSDKSILVFGDSFARDWGKFLTEWFRQIMFLRTPYFHEDIVEQVKPDFVVSQNVERYLNNCHPDEERPSFFMFPHLREEPYGPGKEFAEAFSALLACGREPHRKFLERCGVRV